VALNAAEPVRIATIREFEQRFGLGPVMTPAYGLAEATVGVSTWDPGRPVITDKKSFVSVGKPFSGIEIRIDNGGSGEVGEILVRSPANASGYWDNAPANDELFTDDGFIRTGDMGYVDRDHHLFIVGREKNIIIHGGRNISPKEIEEIIDPLPFVRTSAAFGDDSDRRAGEQVCIFVEIRKDRMGSPGEWEDTLILIHRTFYDYFGFRPGKIILVKPGTIPCTPNRKVKYMELRDRYIEGYYRSGGAILYPEF
jgi:acyl-CoA synthetase (AMP-forming)/AMP-acid ligase II